MDKLSARTKHIENQVKRELEMLRQQQEASITPLVLEQRDSSFISRRFPFFKDKGVRPPVESPRQEKLL